MIAKFFDKRLNKFVEKDDHLFLGVDNKVYEVFAAESKTGSHLDKIDVSDLYKIYFVGYDEGREEVKSDRLDAFELREKIGINTSISGKRLVDLSKEGT